MPDVSLYVAVITAAAGVVGAAVSQIPGYVRDIRQARQDRLDCLADIRRQACIDLLRSAYELRTNVANAVDYHGDEMPARLADIRNVAAAVQLHAAAVALLPLGTSADAAERLAKVAEEFAVEATKNTDLQLNQMVMAPDPAELSRAIETFRKQAVTIVK